MQRDKALEMALGQIEKQYGKGAVMRMDDQAKIKIACIPTGALSLDLALGIGGLPRGRVVEVYGPEGSGKTTVALHAIAEAQKAGGIAAFIDAEHALDPSYAAALGVDIEALLVSQPDNGEQALEIADMLIRSNAIDILVVDSVAALTPKAEIEGEMGDSHVGLQARLMSQALRKLAGTLNRSRTCAVFVNQIREKIGVMFGCFSYGTKVTLADGTQEEIGKIVTQRMDVEVLSYDPDLGRIVPRKVVNWFNNGPTKEFLNVVVTRGGRDGHARFSCTANHQIRTPAGWREAQELSVGDRVLQAVPYHLSDFQWDVVLGGLMGAAALSPTRSGFGARLRWGHGEQQVAYGDWKASLFANVGVRRSTNATGAVFHDVEPLPELEELCDAVCIAGKKVVSHDYLKRLTPLSLAVWYMDAAALAGSSADGQRDRVDICVEAMEATSRERLADWLRDEWGVGSRLTERGGKAILQFRREDIEALQALIAPYVHPSMDDTLLPRFRGQFNVEPVFTEKHNELVPMPVVSITPTSRPADGGETSRYDLEVEGTHNYFVDGVMVHNSPETQPGGRALKFYSSVRLDVRRIESLKDGTDFVGNRVRVKVVKNKCVAAGTRVFDPTTGITHAIEDIVDRGEGSAVWAADKRGVLHVGAIGARLDQGQQEVIGLVLADGTELRVTPDHLVLTEEGWRPAGELPPGARVARPRRAGGFGQHEPLHDDAVPGTRLHPAFFSLEASAQVVANLLYGIWERDGWVSDERTGGLRCGFLTTSEQLAWQLHWLLLRWGISTSVMARHPRPRRSLATGGGVEAEAPCWQVRTRGIEDVRRFAAALPMAGPKGKKLIGELARSQSRTHHGGPTANLPASQTAPILAYLRHRGVSATRVASLIGVSATRAQGGMRSVLGQGRLRRDRIETLAEALDSTFLRDVVAEELYYDRIVSITPARWERTFDLEVDELHNFVADDVVVHNCAPPFRQAEFDIMFGHGISREGSVLDVGVEHGIVKKAGAWYTYDGEQLGQGRENARSFLKEHDEVCAEIYKKVTEALGLVPTDVTGTDGDGEDVLAPGPVDR